MNHALDFPICRLIYDPARDFFILVSAMLGVNALWVIATIVYLMARLRQGML